MPCFVLFPCGLWFSGVESKLKMGGVGWGWGMVVGELDLFRNFDKQKEKKGYEYIVM